MDIACRGVRGATTVDSNDSAAILVATRELLERIAAANSMRVEDIASVIFSTTPDLDAEFPARAAREMGWRDVALLCTHEMRVPDAMPRCIRVLLHWNTRNRPDEIRHIYLHGARRLRPDRVAPGDQGTKPSADAGAPAPLGHVSILGLGLIGASFAGALRTAGAARRVTGFDADATVTARALDAGLIDHAEAEPEAAVAGADTIVLAAPVRAILVLLDRVAPHLRPGSLVFDVGSTKRRIVERMNGLPPAVRAVGGHPMCGKESGGIEHADPDLFHGATFALCETERTDAGARAAAEQLVVALGARPLWTDPEAHDHAVAAVSHLPYLLSIALVSTAFDGGSELAGRLAASGFRDASRLAASQVRMTADFLVTNADAVERVLGTAARTLDHLRALLTADDGERLEERLASAAALRKEWAG